MKPTLIALLSLFLSLPLVAADKDKSLPKDFKSLKALAEKGDVDAQFELGKMCYFGDGVKQDFKESVKWWQKAADQGYVYAQYRLGFMYEFGRGVLKVAEDDVQAYAWYNIAAANGNAAGKTYKCLLEPKMTPAQIAEAGELVKEMIKKNPKLLN
jgi:TPR repeat protein